MNLTEINDKIEQIGNAWEHFKQINDERLKQIEKKGSADGTVVEELDKINKTLTEQKSRLESFEINKFRPSFEVKEDHSSFENMEYKKALNNYLRKGSNSLLNDMETKSDLTTSVSTDSSYGGFLLTSNMQKIIAGELNENCFMRNICSVQTISSGSLEIIDDTNFETSWISETGAIEDSDPSILSKMTIKTHDLVAQPKVSQRLLDDSFINIEEWLSNRLAEQFLDKEEEAFLNGEGDTSNQPTGIISNSSSLNITKSGSNINGGLEAEDIVDLYYSLKEQYVGNASFVMPRSAVSAIRMLKDSTSGAYLWQPSLLGGKEDTLMGAPVYQSSHMPALASKSLSVIFGNFKFYQIVDRTGITILRDPYTAKPYVRFYTTKRVGGNIIKKEAFKLLECGSNT